MEPCECLAVQGCITPGKTVVPIKTLARENQSGLKTWKFHLLSCACPAAARRPVLNPFRRTGRPLWFGCWLGCSCSAYACPSARAPHQGTAAACRPLRFESGACWSPCWPGCSSPSPGSSGSLPLGAGCRWPPATGASSSSSAAVWPPPRRRRSCASRWPCS